MSTAGECAPMPETSRPWHLPCRGCSQAPTRRLIRWRESFSTCRCSTASRPTCRRNPSPRTGAFGAKRRRCCASPLRRFSSTPSCTRPSCAASAVSRIATACCAAQRRRRKRITCARRRVSDKPRTCALVADGACLHAAFEHAQSSFKLATRLQEFHRERRAADIHAQITDESCGGAQAHELTRRHLPVLRRSSARTDEAEFGKLNHDGNIDLTCAAHLRDRKPFALGHPLRLNRPY